MIFIAGFFYCNYICNMTNKEFEKFLDDNYDKLSISQWLTVSWWTFFNYKKSSKFVTEVELRKDIIKAFYNTKYD